MGARHLRQAGAVCEGGVGPGRRACHRLLLLLHPVVVFFRADEPHLSSSPTPALRPGATKVRTRFTTHLWMPRPSSRGGHRVHHRVASHAAGDEPGWESFLTSVDAVVAARAAPLAFLPCFPCFLSRVSRPGRRVAVAAIVVTPACTRARSRAHSRACAPTHARTLFGGQGRDFGSVFPSHRAPPTRLSRRCGLFHAIALAHARARGKGKAFRTPLRVLAAVRARAFGRRRL
jgi:hypothetical protein